MRTLYAISLLLCLLGSIFIPEFVNHLSPAKALSFYHFVTSNNLDFFWINKDQDLGFLAAFETVNTKIYALQITLGFYSLTVLLFFVCLNIQINGEISTDSEVKIFWSSLVLCTLMFTTAFVLSDTHALQGSGKGRLLMVPIRAFQYPLILYEFVVLFIFALSFNMTITTVAFAVFRKISR